MPLFRNPRWLAGVWRSRPVSAGREWLRGVSQSRPYLRSRWFVAVVVIAVVMPAAWLLAHETAGSDVALVAQVKRGEFTVTVTTSGELKAQESVKITGPANMQQAEVYQTKIASIIPEGTVVKPGDVVAEQAARTSASATIPSGVRRRSARPTSVAPRCPLTSPSTACRRDRGSSPGSPRSRARRPGAGPSRR